MLVAGLTVRAQVTEPSRADCDVPCGYAGHEAVVVDGGDSLVGAGPGHFLAGGIGCGGELQGLACLNLCLGFVEHDGHGRQLDGLDHLHLVDGAVACLHNECLAVAVDFVERLLVEDKDGLAVGLRNLGIREINPSVFVGGIALVQVVDVAALVEGVLHLHAAAHFGACGQELVVSEGETFGVGGDGAGFFEQQALVAHFVAPYYAMHLKAVAHKEEAFALHDGQTLLVDVESGLGGAVDALCGPCVGRPVAPVAFYKAD